MKRKIIQIADSTQLVSLPRKWALEHNIKKGSEIEVTIKGDTLEISPGPKKGETLVELEADITEFTPFLADRFLIRIYQKGYDRVTLLFKSPEIMKKIREKIPQLLGFEVLKKSPRGCIIQSVSSDLAIDFNTILRRVFMIILEMSELCLKTFEEKDEKFLNIVSTRDKDVNKFCYFSLRCLNKKYYTEGMKNPLLFYHIENLEHLGDHFISLTKEVVKKENNDKKIGEMLELLNNLLKTSYEFYYSPTKKLAHSCLEQYDALQEALNSSEKLKCTDCNKLLFSIRSIANILYYIPTMRLELVANVKTNLKE